MAGFNMNILITEPEDYSPEAIKMLETLGDVTCKKSSQNELAEIIEDVDILVVRLGLNINEHILRKAKKLRYILTATTGIDHIDMTIAEEQNIQIISLKGETTFLNSIPSTAEHTWGLLLALLRNIPAAVNHVKQGGWERQFFRGHNLRHMKIGILGLGRVGKQVAGFANCFGMIVSAFDPYQKEWLPNVKRSSSSKELFKNNSIISVHLPLNKETTGYINEELLNCMSKGSYLINTSRGAVCNECHVVEAFISGILSGIATDVITTEKDYINRENSQLLQLTKNNDRVIITPHIAGATYESMKLTEEFIVRKLINNING